MPDDVTTASWRRFAHQRQTHGETRTFVWSIRLSTDRAAVKLHELPHQRETNTQSTMSSPVTSISLPKHLKNMRQETRIDSLPCVFNNQNRVIAFTVQTDLDTAAGRRKLHRIIQHVPGNLL